MHSLRTVTTAAAAAGGAAVFVYYMLVMPVVFHTQSIKAVVHSTCWMHYVCWICSQVNEWVHHFNMFQFFSADLPTLDIETILGGKSFCNITGWKR